MPRPLVSVIVVAWNAADVLGRCLDHLVAQDYANREIIVVDDGSDDDTFNVAERAAAQAPLTLLRSKGNRGCPAARNLGLRHAGGEIVAFVDADGFAAPDWLTRIVATFAEDRTIGGVASTVFYDDNPIVVNGAGGTVNRQGWAADLSMNESFEFAELGTEALYPMGCGMAVCRAALERVGRFDDRMHNYYDDVDYGMRLWRAGYRVVVAADAWIDHRATGGDSARKRLWCERHRMRVVLRHNPPRVLPRWLAYEARGLRAASPSARAQKLRAIAWNVGHLPSVLAYRARSRGMAPLPETLVADVWGDSFPADLPSRTRPRPELAHASVEMADPNDEAGLPYGWFPAERFEGRGFRWAGARAAAIISLREPARRLRLDYAHTPVDVGGIDVEVRRIGADDPFATVWRARLPWQYVARSVENHPVSLESGEYEVLFASRHVWCDASRDARSLAFALASLSMTAGFEMVPGGIEMSAASVEEQLVHGWFEPEASPERAYRWAGRSAAAVVRLSEGVCSARLTYRLPPVSIGDLAIALAPIDGTGATWSTVIPWRDGDWHEDELELTLEPGDYLLSIETDSAWSNPDGRQAGLWPEGRALGAALASLSFSQAAPARAQGMVRGHTSSSARRDRADRGPAH